MRGAAAISLGQAALMGSGGVLALLITQYFGKGAATDAFFTAYGFYVIAVAFAQTLRLTALPRLMGDVTGVEESRMLAAAVGMAILAAVPMLLLATPIGKLIANGDPSHQAAQTLRLLWAALGLHLVAGVLVPMLTLRGLYASIGWAFGAAGVVSVVAFVLLQPELGLQAVSAGLALSAALLAVALALVLRRTKWRVIPHTFRDVASIARDAGWLTVSSASFLVMNTGYLICLAVANHESRGTATTYAYAFFGAAFLVATTAVPIALVRAPGRLDTAGKAGLTVEETIADYRMALVLLTPVIGGATLMVPPLAVFVAGDFFAVSDAHTLVWELLALVPWVLASIIGVMVVLDLLNRNRVRPLAWLALAHVVGILPLAVVGRIGLGILGVALAQSLAMLTATGIQLRLEFGDASRTLTARLGKETIRAALAGAIAFGPPALASAFTGMLVDVLLGLTGSAVCLALLSRMFRAEWVLVLSLTRVPRRA